MGIDMGMTMTVNKTIGTMSVSMYYELYCVY